MRTPAAESGVCPTLEHNNARVLRILFLVDELESMSAGGSERQVLQLIDILRNAGHEVSFAVLRKSNWLREEGKDYAIRFCDVQSVLSPRGVVRLWKLVMWMREQRFDLVQTMFRESNLIGPPLARLAGVPVVLGSRRNLNHAMSRSFAFLQGFSNRCATRLVANSEAVKTVVNRREKTPLSRIDVLYNGIDTRYFALVAERGEEVRLAFGIHQNALLVGVVSRFARIKGLDIFVRAAKRVLDNSPETRFMMVGGGPSLPETRDLAAQLGIENKCKFVPEQRDIRPFLSAFDIAVLPSRSEGFSNSLLEYMCGGVAIVATDVGGNREALGEAGMLVPAEDEHALANAILKLIESPEERRVLGQRARTRVQERFDIERARLKVSEYVAHLTRRSVLSGAAPRNSSDL